MDIDSSPKRSIEDVNEMLNLAKMTENDILPTSQIVYFDESFSKNNNIKLLELDKNLLKEIEEGQEMWFKGEKEDAIVLCTKNKTYSIVGAETSNSLLMVENLKTSEQLTEKNHNLNKCTVKKIFFEYMECIPAKANLKKLNEILKKSIYKGPEYEFETNKNDLYTRDALLAILQASECEFEKALENFNVVLIDGKIRIMDVQYHFRILSYMLKLMDENSWNLDQVDYSVTVDSLIDLAPVEVIDSLFKYYAVESEKIGEDRKLYKYDEAKVCRFIGKILLETGNRFKLNDFFQVWKESVPDGMVPTEEMLFGIAIVDSESFPKTIRAFSEENLAENIIERFNALFEAKNKWTVAEIAPYIQTCTTDKLNVNALLAKHARASNKNGVKYYSSKHSK